MSDYSGEFQCTNIRTKVLHRTIEVFRIIQVSDYAGSTVHVNLIIENT